MWRWIKTANDTPPYILRGLAHCGFLTSSFPLRRGFELLAMLNSHCAPPHPDSLQILNGCIDSFTWLPAFSSLLEPQSVLGSWPGAPFRIRPCQPGPIRPQPLVSLGFRDTSSHSSEKSSLVLHVRHNRYQPNPSPCSEALHLLPRDPASRESLRSNQDTDIGERSWRPLATGNC